MRSEEQKEILREEITGLQARLESLLQLSTDGRLLGELMDMIDEANRVETMLVNKILELGEE